MITQVMSSFLKIYLSADLPTLSAPRSGSDFRMLWKWSARSLGGVFHARLNSSAYIKNVFNSYTNLIRAFYMTKHISTKLLYILHKTHFRRT